VVYIRSTLQDIQVASTDQSMCLKFVAWVSSIDVVIEEVNRCDEWLQFRNCKSENNIYCINIPGAKNEM